MGDGGEGYASPGFRAASAVVDTLTKRRSILAALVYLVSNWRSVRMARRYVAGLPPIDAGAAFRVSPGPMAAAVRNAIGLDTVAVLTVPEELSQYTAGRSRQALRTNLNHARRLGVTCADLSGTEQEAADVHAFLASRGVQQSPEFIRHAIEYSRLALVARTHTGQIVGVCVVDPFGESALLAICQVADGDEGFYARYALHLAAVERLHGQGVRRLLAGPAFGVHPRLEYVQYLLGYRPERVIFRQADRVS